MPVPPRRVIWTFCAAWNASPFPTVESLVHVQRLMKLQNPKIGDVKLEDVNDSRLIKKLDDSGFIDKAFAAQGMK
jgi:hypothetical protein